MNHAPLGVCLLLTAPWLTGCAQQPAASPSRPAQPVTREFAVAGMSCEGCVSSITDALTKIPGVQSATVSLEQKKAVVVADPAQVPTEKIEAEIAGLGYQGKLKH